MISNWTPGYDLDSAHIAADGRVGHQMEFRLGTWGQEKAKLSSNPFSAERRSTGDIIRTRAQSTLRYAFTERLETGMSRRSHRLVSGASVRPPRC